MADRIHVFTYKEGLLSRVAHDLRLHVEPRGIHVLRSGDEVSAELDPHALTVDGAMRGAQLDGGALDGRDRAKILDTMRREILSTQRFSKIRFVGTAVARGDHELSIDGELELVGVRRPLRFVATREGRRVRARVTLRPSLWGIAPYKALAGAIRLQVRVSVELDLDDPE
jgi:polyisoprenoid-binding protein YceI